METLKKKQQQESAEAQLNASENEQEKLEKKHQQELNAEIKAMDTENQIAISSLRNRLAAENEAVLKAQDAQLGLLIGKLQVGQARRRGIIQKNDKAIKELQDQLVDTIAESDVSSQQTNNIIKKHLREVDDLQGKMQDAKEKQYRVLKDKVEARMIKKDKAIESDINEEKMRQKTESDSAKDKSKRTALSLMNKMLIDQRHQRAKKQLEQDMKAELAEQQQQLHQQLEQAMFNELEEREKDFLAQLAAVSNMSKSDVNHAVQSAVAYGGGDEEDARLMTKDFNKRIKSAKMEVEKDEDDDEEVVQKPKKKKKGKKK